MDLFHLKLFRDIAHSRSISRGAESNQVSQSAASQHLQELERVLEVELVDRSCRPLELTQAGELYLDFCRDVLRRREEFDNALSQLKANVAGTVRIASIFSVGLVEMSRLEEEFAARFPKARIEVEYLRPERVYEAIRSGRAEIGLVSYPQAAKDLAIIPWREEEMVVAAAPTHPIALLGRVRPADLEGMEFIGFDPELPIRRELDRYFKDHDVSVKIAKHFDSIPMIKEALALGNVVSILPERMLRAEVAEGRLICVPLESPGLIRPLGIVHLKKRKFHRATQAFLDLLQEGVAASV